MLSKFGEPGIGEATLIQGEYAVMSMFMDVARTPLDPDTPPPTKPFPGRSDLEGRASVWRFDSGILDAGVRLRSTQRTGLPYDVEQVVRCRDRSRLGARPAI